MCVSLNSRDSEKKKNPLDTILSLNNLMQLYLNGFHHQKFGGTKKKKKKAKQMSLLEGCGQSL